MVYGPDMAPLETLAERTGKPFQALTAARRQTEKRLIERRRIADGIEKDSDVAIVLMGSWGRRELTSGSDDDFMVLVRGEQRDVVNPSVEAVAETLAIKAPGREGIFGEAVFSVRLREDIGLDRDSNTNLTRRLLLLLESVAVSGDGEHAAVQAEVLEEYLEGVERDYRPPRFLLNDVVRYWRTLGVDYAAKVRQRGPTGWALRNAKLRTSRKLLYASGLIPILRCHELKRTEMIDFLSEQLRLPPTDRIADACLHYGNLAHGSQILDAYDKFIELLDNAEARDLLTTLGPEDARSPGPFLTATQLGAEIDDGLRGLLFGPALSRWTMEFAVL